ncbi:helix-turn-helix domain-containing protein [Chitinophaga rhizophila]|uniref:Helix-turn-helix domain-containing protein n=1 Tax=Chitinophaga rhizophila TaxID=2866212 RepID=A0ABS7GAP6_9BACT|nr:helix-turn-helix domain-containing protein [Chitinophaga rhizophila]MBW8684486.1 helix-turn-helix domain-containing protein [Chitinophaga rhizophila]
MRSMPVCTVAGFQPADFRGFKVYEISGTSYPALVYGRRDVYKIVLTTGNMRICYGDQVFDMDDTFLFFGNPYIPYSVEHHSAEQQGFACLFTEAFIDSRERKDSLLNSALFRYDGTPVVPVSREQAAFVTTLYQTMISAYDGDYNRKDEMLRNCIDLIMHEALRILPQVVQQEKNAAGRITYLFLEMLERQFPIGSVGEALKLRNPADYAASLSVHVNYLNRSVKEITGKPISVHIAERVVAEAKALLLHSNWSVADIAYGLGFEYPSYFNNYFKRVSGHTPNTFRKAQGKV